MAGLEQVELDQVQATGLMPTGDRDWQGSTVFVPWFTLADGRKFYLKSDPHGREQLAWLLGRGATNTVPVVRLARGAGPALARRYRGETGAGRIRARLAPDIPLVGLRCAEQWRGRCPVSDWWEAMIRHLVFAVWLRDYDRRSANERNPAALPLVDAVHAALRQPAANPPDLWQLLPADRPPPVVFDHGGSPQERVWVTAERFLSLSRRIRHNVSVVTANLLRPADAGAVAAAVGELAARGGAAPLAGALAAIDAPAADLALHRTMLAQGAGDLAGGVQRTVAALQWPALRAAAGRRGLRWVW